MSRIAFEAAEVIRAAIRETGGMEVFAIGDVRGETVVSAEVVCRGQTDRVNALIGRPRHGQVVLHNHPSGDLTPSSADMQLAGRYGEDGVGFVIVDSEVSRSNWVVEPPRHEHQPLEPQEIEQFFREVLPRIGLEVREPQVQMAHDVAASISDGRPVAIEAGTGTGKSLAYLVPAALWAVKNDTKVVIATHTRALQVQLQQSDLPILARAGLEVRTAVLVGRSNYLCKRRLELSISEQEELPQDQQEDLVALRNWAESTKAGVRSELAFNVHRDVWDRVSSDSDLSLKVRCPHYETCHFYTARRNAAGAHVVVVNHALLLADLSLRAEIGRGVLPTFDRVILDEAHHLEEVATGAGTRRVTAEAVHRAITPRIGRRKRPGALARLTKSLAGADLPGDVVDSVGRVATEAAALLEGVDAAVGGQLDGLAGTLDPQQPTQRITPATEESAEWKNEIVPTLSHAAQAIEEAVGLLDGIHEALGDHRLPPAKAQPLLDVDRAMRRLDGHAYTLRAFIAGADDAECRWLEVSRRRNRAPSAAVCIAPIDLAKVLQRILWEPLGGSVCTSATLTVGGSFAFWQDRVGNKVAQTRMLPSPFDHFNQALLGLPRDLPQPNHPDYLHRAAQVVVEAVRIAGGGAFVLCTSYRAVEAFATALRAAMPAHMPVLAQGTAARSALLGRFKQHRSAVLVGTDSFWEGVSVKGDALRLVIVPRLPFRVPTEPLRQARHERLVNLGRDPFRAYSLPEAALKLRQGYGRLIRAASDRGVVLLLDRRLHERSYGRVLLAALPPARRIAASWERVAHEMKRFYGDTP